MTIDNPYVPPESDVLQANPLRLPAGFLIFFAGLFLVLLVLSLPMMLELIQAVDTSTPRGMGNVTGQILFIIGTATSNSVIILGSIAMLRRRGYGLAKCAAIVACIPICSPCYILGIPFAIWALLLLGRAEVRSSFS